MRCPGELASGSAVVAVTVSDMSVTGCGIEVDDDSVGALGRGGVPSVRSSGDAAAVVMLPVIVPDHRVAGDRARLGLQFPRPGMGQMRNLIGVMDGAIER